MLDDNSNIDSENLRNEMEELRKGSAEAFKILYAKYNGKVYRFCLRMLNDTMLAEDAFQETFIKVYEHRKEFRGKNFAAWLFTIARHTCYNLMRTRKEYDDFDETYFHNPQPKQRDVAMKDFVEQALAVLPLPLKEAIILREYEDCSYQDIAEILGIQLSLAKVRVHRAREILRKLLAPIKQEINES
jgi:RNA polymerase sigma-70 factor (ECF subfamily)